MRQALTAWRKKLDYLQQQEAINADPSLRFALAEQIEEARAKIVALETGAGSQQPKNPVAFHADISRIVKDAPAELIGRDEELEFLNATWAKVQKAESSRPHILTFVALGGEGKTSLVAKWAAELANQNWPGCHAAFAWSFYSQGTREQTAASSDVFLKEALTFFGDPVLANSAQGAFDKGRRLAQLVGEGRALLILDGLEPLQYAPTSPTPGELKDQGIAALLKGLAATGHGLCIVTTRYSIPDLRAYWQTTAPEMKLLRLSKAAGVALLQSLGVKGVQLEFAKLVEDVQGHALTLNLLGTYLHDAHAGDIRKRDLVKLQEAADEQGGHAFRAMDAYVQWFEIDGEKGRRALVVLQLIGLFDRPTTAGCLTALLNAPAISGLTDALVGISEAQRNVTFTRLENAKLLTVNRDGAGALVVLDAHPLLREYFARRLRNQQPEAWRAAHQRLYEHLCATTPDKPQPTLEDLQPLYQAVSHGCQAGMQAEARANVYRNRIQRREEFYSTFMLGAVGSDLGAIACFFEQPWGRLSPAITGFDRAWLLNEAAFSLRALGRLAEALEPMRAAVELAVSQEHWRNSAIATCNLSELELMLGQPADAARDAEQSVVFADLSGNVEERTDSRATRGDVWHYLGREADAEASFREAEALHAANQPDYPLLYSFRGYRYCELLLGAPERAMWHAICGGGQRSREQADSERAALHSILQRAAQTLTWVEFFKMDILSSALDHLIQGRAALCQAVLEDSSLEPCRSPLQDAINGLRRGGQQDYLLRGLLPRALMRGLTGALVGPDSAQGDLDEAWEIAERGPMPLFMADIHLHRARLFFCEAQYPWESPQADLAAAREIIERCSYRRRQEELEDAEKVIPRH